MAAVMATILGSFFAKSVIVRPKMSEHVGVVAGFGGTVVDLIGSESVELAGIVDGGLIAPALLGDDVEDDGFVERLEMLEGSNKKRQVVAVDGAVVAQSEFLEEHVRERAGSWHPPPFWREVAGCLAGDAFDEVRGLGTHGCEGVMRLEIVEVSRDGTDVLVDGPLVVIQHDDELASRLRDVVERFEVWGRK
jgi:hypothetical protein